MPPHDDPTDAELLQRVAQGDMGAMKALYLRHATALTRFVTQYVRDHATAADVVQTTMLEVWRSADRFEGRSEARTWMLAMAKFKAIDHIRRQSKLSVVDPQSAAFEDVDAQNAESIVAAAQDAAQLRDCVARLPDQQRAAIHLAFFQDLTYAEVADIEGVPEGTIKTRIFHAKKLLMRCLTSDGTKS